MRAGMRGSWPATPRGESVAGMRRLKDVAASVRTARRQSCSSERRRPAADGILETSGLTKSPTCRMVGQQRGMHCNGLSIPTGSERLSRFRASAWSGVRRYPPGDGRAR